MRITFLRLGHANNSSSSHSLIFINQPKYDSLKKRGKIGTDERKEFGQGLFTINDISTKLTYYFLSIHNYFSEKGGNLDDFQDQDSDSNNIEETIEFLKSSDLLSFYGSNIPSDEKLKQILLSSYVDHQSCMIFPLYRDISRGLNLEFIKAFLQEVTKENYTILGGGDGGYGDDHALFKHRNPADTDLIRLWKDLTEVGDKVLCEYDTKTEEFVLSFTDSSGILMKVKF